MKGPVGTGPGDWDTDMLEKPLFCLPQSHVGRMFEKCRVYYYSGMLRPLGQETIAIGKDSLCPGLAAPLVGASSATPKGWGFESLSGHIGSFLVISGWGACGKQLLDVSLSC